MEHIIDERGNNLQCPFGGCNDVFRDWTLQQIITHFNLHFGSNCRSCPFRGCGQELLNFDGQQVIAHFKWHFGFSRHHCPFVGCGQDLKSVTQQQFLTHINTHFASTARICPYSGCGVDLGKYTIQADEPHIRRHIFVPRCPFQHCGRDLDGFTEQQRRVHLNDHLGPRKGLNQHHCPFQGCRTFLRAWTNKRRLEHMTNHIVANRQLPPWTSPNCSFENCSQSFTNLSQTQIAQHLQTHRTGSQPTIQAHQNQGTRCPLCIFQWDGVNGEMLRNHFYFTHYPENPTDFVCPNCSSRINNNSETVLTHYRNHVNDAYCTWEGCHYQYPAGARPDDKRKHLLTHVRQVCQWPGCENVYVEEPTDEVILAHILEHAYAYGVRLGTQVPVGLSPQRPGDQSPGPPEEDQNNIPQRLRDANPGMQFYCPRCLHKVSGGNASACRVSSNSFSTHSQS
jgi:hypothetical protein